MATAVYQNKGKIVVWQSLKADENKEEEEEKGSIDALYEDHMSHIEKEIVTDRL